MKKSSVELVVKSKLSYLWLLVIPIAIVKVIFDFIDYQNLGGGKEYLLYFVSDCFVTAFILTVGISFFYKLNTYSAYMNPHHPKKNTKKEDV